jgi:hypothetical protein
MLVPVLARFLNRSFQPHLDQMEHCSVDDSASHRLQKVGVWKRIEGTYDTLPIISTSQKK